MTKQTEKYLLRHDADGEAQFTERLEYTVQLVNEISKTYQALSATTGDKLPEFSAEVFKGLTSGPPRNWVYDQMHRGEPAAMVGALPMNYEMAVSMAKFPEPAETLFSLVENYRETGVNISRKKVLREFITIENQTAQPDAERVFKHRREFYTYATEKQTVIIDHLQKIADAFNDFGAFLEREQGYTSGAASLVTMLRNDSEMGNINSRFFTTEEKDGKLGFVPTYNMAQEYEFNQ